MTQNEKGLSRLKNRNIVTVLIEGEPLKFNRNLAKISAFRWVKEQGVSVHSMQEQNEETQKMKKKGLTKEERDKMLSNTDMGMVIKENMKEYMDAILISSSVEPVIVEADATDIQLNIYDLTTEEKAEILGVVLPDDKGGEGAKAADEFQEGGPVDKPGTSG